MQRVSGARLRSTYVRHRHWLLAWHTRRRADGSAYLRRTPDWCTRQRCGCQIRDIPTPSNRRTADAQSIVLPGALDSLYLDPSARRIAQYRALRTELRSSRNDTAGNRYATETIETRWTHQTRSTRSRKSMRSAKNVTRDERRGNHLPGKRKNFVFLNSKRNKNRANTS